YVGEGRIELFASHILDRIDRGFERPSTFIRSLAKECVQIVGQRHDSDFKWNRGPGQAVRITGTVPPLMMAQHDALGHLEKRVLAPGQDLSPDGCMMLQ